MLRPTSIDVLRCIGRTLDTMIVPALNGVAERSAAATIGHLLRHVTLRIEHEGRILHDEIVMLRPLLAQARDYLQARGAGDPEATRVGASVERALSATAPTSSGEYRDVGSLADEVWALRQGVTDALQYVLARKSGGADATAKLHDAIETYMAWQLERESELIDPAFEGFGPRR
ncbi:MAG TPA: hypothetical protein VJQ47_09805 [Steroidobacteraceae bacterium]|nr:hypothetical protein [Steroidobacteraceae bacterium]